nr:intron-binding protein aquarius [Quercus suber]
MYLRLLGYPANKISILTTYNGQKLLIRDVINRRCVPYDFIDPPSKVTTVDKFQAYISTSASRPDRLALNLNEITSYTERHVEDTRPIHLVSGVEEMISIFNWSMEEDTRIDGDVLPSSHSNGEVDKEASKNDENDRQPESNSSEENMTEQCS